MTHSQTIFWMFTASDLAKVHGPVIHFVEMARALHNHGIPIKAFAPGPGRYFENLPYEIVQTRYWVRFLPRTFSYQLELLGLIPHLFRKDPQRKNIVFYIRQSSTMLIPQLLSRLFKIPVFLEINGLMKTHTVISRRNSFLQWLFPQLEKLSFRMSDVLLPVTKGLAEMLHKEYGVKNKPIHVISNGVNIQKYQTKKVSDQEKSAFSPSIHSSSTLIGYVGSIEHWQGFDLLIASIKKMTQRLQDFTVLVIGSGSIENEVKIQIKQEKLEHHFLFMGERTEPEVVSLLSLCCMGIIAKHRVEILRHDLSSIKLYTYLAMSLPVIACDVPGVQFLTEQECGLVVPPNDATAFMEAMQSLLQNPKKAKRMGQNGRRWVEKKFDWSILAESVLKLLP